MKIGVGSYAFRFAINHPALPAAKRMGLEGLLEFCVENEVEVLQICDNIALNTLDTKLVSGAAAFAKARGIEIELGTTGYNPGHLREYIELCKVFNSRILRTVLNARDAEEVAVALERIIPNLEARDVVLAIENHFDLNPVELANMVARINHPRVKVCMDPLNSISLFWGVNETFDALRSSIASAHVKDAKMTRQGSGFLVSGCPLGEGIAGVDEYIARVHEANPACNIFLEQWMDALGDVEETLAEEREWVMQGLNYLNQQLENYKNKLITS